MAKDLSDTVRNVVTHAARDTLKNLSDAKPGAKKSNGRLSGASGVAAGAGLAAMVPLAKKGVDAIRSGAIPTSPSKLARKAAPSKVASNAASKAGDRVGSQLKDAVSSTVDEAGGAGGLVKDAASALIPGMGGDSGGGKGGMPGVGKGRRMPVQQAVDVAVPLETAYNQWTQFEDWPEFMHRVTRVTQEDDCTVSFATKIWGKTKEFEAQIDTQRPDERIKWRVSQGITHSGVVTFHELAPRLTRIEITLDVDPGSLIEKAARGMRHVKRAVRADLHRYKAFIEMQELETGAWRGVIEEGELVEPHDDDYDEERDYSDIEELRAQAEEGDEDQDEDTGEQENGGGESHSERTQRFKRQAEGSSGERSSEPTAAASRPRSTRTADDSPKRKSGSSGNGESGSGRTGGASKTSGTSKGGAAKRSRGSTAKPKATARS
jgi:uncharacterized membrane protein